MNTMALLGILAIAYGAFCIFVALKKPAAIWNMKKIEWFKKVLKEGGTVVFFNIWGLAFIALGIWLMIK